jgi:hypothetical protein
VEINFHLICYFAICHLTTNIEDLVSLIPSQFSPLFFFFFFFWGGGGGGGGGGDEMHFTLGLDVIPFLISFLKYRGAMT